MMDEQSKGILCIVVAALLFGSMGVLIRLVDAEVTPVMQVAIRAIFAFALMLAVFRPGRDFLRVSGRDFLYYAVGGVFGYGLMLVLFTLSILSTSIANTFFLLYTEPVFVVALAYVFLKEKVSQRMIVSIFLSFGGIFLIFSPSIYEGNFIGNLYGVAAGFLYAVYILLGRYLGKKHSSPMNTLWFLFFGLMFLVPAAFIFEMPFSLVISSQTWMLLLLFGVVNGTAYFLLNAGLKRVPASYGGVLLLIEPISSIFYALLFFGEVPGASTIAGSVLIVISIMYLTYSEKIKNRG